MQPLRFATAVALALGLASGMAPAEGQELKLSDCPATVRKTLEAEARGARIDAVHKEKGDAQTIYWTEVAIAGQTYAIGILEDGTLAEMNLAVDDTGIPLERCPAAVQATFRREAFGEKPEAVGRDVKYGVPIYEAVVQHRGRSYEIVVADDGTLVEKALVIEDQAIELAKCPAAVQAALKGHARGGEIGDITRSSGIGRPTFEAEVKLKDKVYLVEVAESGLLISKSLEAGEE
jgi:hypothetical protein